MTHRTPVTAAPPSLPPSPAPRSPLRYPGGKTRAREKILSLIPPRTPVICSPFLGGGSIELACAHAGIPVRGYDIYPPLVNFWHHALATPVRLAREVRKYYPLSKETFYHLQQTPPQERGGGTLSDAAVFYTLNRASYAGTTYSGGHVADKHTRFTPRAIERLEHFSITNITVMCADFRDSISGNPAALLYLDPPYFNNKKIYGKYQRNHQFDHASLRDMLYRRHSWVLSYNNHPVIREWYRGYKIIPTDWAYGRKNTERTKELIILSHDVG